MMDTERFGVRPMTWREVAFELRHTKQMLIAAVIASVVMVAIGALFVSLWV